MFGLQQKDLEFLYCSKNGLRMLHNATFPSGLHACQFIIILAPNVPILCHALQKYTTCKNSQIVKIVKYGKKSSINHTHSKKSKYIRNNRKTEQTEELLKNANKAYPWDVQWTSKNCSSVANTAFIRFLLLKHVSKLTKRLSRSHRNWAQIWH